MTRHGVGVRLARSGSALAVTVTVTVTLAATLAAGCASLPAVRDPAQDPTLDTGLTATRAGYVELMLENIVRTSSHDRDGQVFAIVAGYGGGYVTSAHLSGAGGTANEQLTFDTVLGATAVTDQMQGETDFGPSALACFQFAIGYYGMASHHSIPCPAGITPSTAAAEAKRQADAAQAARGLSVVVKDAPVPLDLAAAQHDGIGVLPSASAATGLAPSASASAPPLNPADFATAHGVAAISVPQPGGACVYLSLTGSPASNGSPGGVSVYGWAAPTRDPCTGQAALSEGGYVSNDPYAGG